MTSLLLCAAHMLGDYVFQTPWMAMNKLNDWKARTIHVLVYTLCFAPFLALADADIYQASIFMGVTFVTHWIIDTRRWCEEWAGGWFPKAIMWDQSFHITQLALTGYIVGL